VQPPRVTSSRVVYENRWMRLHEDRTERPDGTSGLYAWVEKPQAAVIVPRDGDHVWLIEQHRHPVGARFWEFPQGAWEDAPGAGAEDLARGELAKKTGLRDGRLEHLGRLFFAYGLTNQSFDVWLASELAEGAQALEATEADLRVGRVAVGEFEAMIDRGEIRDAATVAAWHLAVRRDRTSTAAG
jgi:8-oxo-dGTP pyrophosphatase MutT (NUDIX family)